MYNTDIQRVIDKNYYQINLSCGLSKDVLLKLRSGFCELGTGMILGFLICVFMIAIRENTAKCGMIKMSKKLKRTNF